MRVVVLFFFFFNDTATTEIYTLSLHDALPISRWTEEAESPLHYLGGLQESWPSAFLYGPSRNGGRQASANFLYECGRQASGVGHLGGREIANERLVPSSNVVYIAVSRNED